MDDIEPISPPNSELDRLRTENATLTAQLASHQIDIDTFREGNMQLRAQLAEARAALAAATLTAPTSGGKEE